MHLATVASLLLSFEGDPLGFSSLLEFALAVAVVISFALVAWGMRAVTVAGALAGALIAFVLYAAAGLGGFLTLLTVFVLTVVSTRFGYSKKHKMQTAERANGRTLSQVLANLGAAGLCAAPLMFVGVSREILLTGMVAALCEAAADTVSSEVGQVVARRTVLITTLKPTNAGQNGGISLPGTLGGLLAVISVAVVAHWTKVLSGHEFMLAGGIGFGGMLLDSVLGATLERPEKMGNDSVNFVGSACSAFGALLVAVTSR
jgi:uncharacterized protein (TIGR00297 family)